jgi:predicted DNA-binding protein
MQTTIVDLLYETKERLREISREENTTMSSLIREAVDKLIKARDRQKAKKATP